MNEDGIEPELLALLGEIAAAPRGVLSANYPGAKVGRYEVVGVLGRGGMGIVERARDHALMRDVAIKRVAEGDARFLAEARLLAAARHPAFPAVYLHALGLVHRDLKPENVVIDVSGRARLVDFGIGARIGEVDPHGAGSAGYLAPEQREGEPANPCDDVYAFGRLAEGILAEPSRAWASIIADCARPRASRIADGRALVARIEASSGLRRGLFISTLLFALAFSTLAVVRAPAPVARVTALTQRSADNSVDSAILSPDGDDAIVTDARGNATILDLGGGERALAGRVLCPQFSADGDSIWTGASEGSVRRKRDGTEIERAPFPSCSVISPRGDRALQNDLAAKRIAIISRDGSSQVIARTGSTPITAAWSPDGARIAMIEAYTDIRGRGARVVVGELDRWTTVAEDRSIVGPLGGGAVNWTGDESLIYARWTRAGAEVLEIDVGGGEPRRIATVPRVSAESLSASTDGRRILLFGSESESDIVLGTSDGAFSKFMSSTGTEIVASFSASGDALWVMSDSRRVLSHKLSAREISPLFSDEIWRTWPIAADASGTMLSWSLVDDVATLERSGERLLTSKEWLEVRGGERPPPFLHHVRCAPAVGRCVLLRRSEEAIALFAFDARGALPEVPTATLALAGNGDYGFALAPDASRVAIPEGSDIRVIGLDGVDRGRIALPDACGVQYVAWDGPHEAVIATQVCGDADPAYRLWRAPLVGAPTLLWHSNETWMFSPAVSPDGARIAATVLKVIGNAWLIQR